MTRTTIGLLLIGLLFFAGCGPQGRGLKVEYVEGVITLDGEPLADATVTFHARDEDSGAVTAAGMSNQRGIYKLSSTDSNPEAGTTVGEYIVTVSKVEVHDPTIHMTPEEAMVSNLRVTHTQLLPAIYQDRERTPLSATVNRGRNKIDLELKSNP